MIKPIHVDNVHNFVTSDSSKRFNCIRVCTQINIIATVFVVEHCAYQSLDSICGTFSMKVYMYKHMGCIPDRQFSSCKLMTLDISHYIAVNII